MDRQSSITTRDLECMLLDETTKPKALPLSLLEEITNGFSDDQEIGSGGYAVVYKGNLDNKTVAVKRLSIPYKYEKEFNREVECLMMVKHKNIVRFRGYCADTQGSVEKYKGKFVMADVQKKLLCFEYLRRGSLHKYITDSSRRLQWRDCYQIITGICEGLHYLHQENIAHLDLKPENILLDDNLVAKIADFGLARCFDEMQSRVISKIEGTLGYLAPECFNHTKVAYRDLYRLDVYSLGVVILEILTGEKGNHNVQNVVESWRDKLERSQRDILVEQVRVCAEIGIECIASNPAKRPDTKHIMNRLNKYNANLDLLYETMDSLNPDIRRCLEYCSIFPRGSMLRRDDLICLWIAQGFIKTSCETEDMEDIAGGYIQDLVSISFLEPIGTSSDSACFIVQDMVHDILDKVGTCFRIENERSLIGEAWEGAVPRDVQHLFVQNYDAELINGKILGLENLRTLIVYAVGKDTPIEEKVIESICQRLPKLRILAVAFSKEHDPIEQPKFSFPESVGQLEYLRYLGFRANSECKITLPSTINKLHHIQLLDFGIGQIAEFTFAELVNLRHIFCWENMKLAYVGKLSSLQTLPGFKVSNAQGCELKQLRDLNKLQGKLCISGLKNVKSKAQALQANLTAKERLTVLSLWWGYDDEPRWSREVEADVLEGLCPPVGLQKLVLVNFAGCRYPDWMLGKDSAGPKYLQKLILWYCSQPVPASGLSKAFPHLRVLDFSKCSWDNLPGNMKHLTSLKKLIIYSCKNILSLPSLPQSLEEVRLAYCNDEFIKSCQTAGHPNWQKIEHIPNKSFW